MTHSLLVADDSTTIRQLVELAFMEGQFRVTTVDRGDVAIELALEQAPDVVVADVNMPGASGYEVSRRVKAVHPETPVLLLVGTFEAFDEGEFAACGASGFLKKPFESDELVARVMGLVQESGVLAPPSNSSFLPTDPAPPPTRAAAEPPLLAVESPLQAGTPVPQVPGSETPAAHVPVPAVPVPPIVPLSTSLSSEEPSMADVQLTEEQLEFLARRVAEILGREALKDVAWEVLPDLAEVVIKERIRELESEVEST